MSVIKAVSTEAQQRSSLVVRKRRRHTFTGVRLRPLDAVRGIGGDGVALTEVLMATGKCA